MPALLVERRIRFPALLDPQRSYRKALDLGQSSDPSGSWVGQDITVTVTGTATRK